MAPRKAKLSNHHDRKLALSFGALVLFLMIAVSGTATYLFTELHVREGNRLSSIIATIFADSINRVSFSGKYHARLFVEEIRAQLPEVAFVSLEDLDGRILAHSQPEMNDGYWDEPETPGLRAQSLESDAIISKDRVQDGHLIKEVVLPYRSGFNHAVTGVVRIGIKMDEVRKDQKATIYKLSALICLLSLIGIGGVLLLSRYFGGAHRDLATQLRGILVHAPLLISLTDKEGQLVACSLLSERVFGPARPGMSLQQLIDDHLSDKDVATLLQTNDAIFATGDPVSQELEVTLNGNPHIWHVSKFPIAHDNRGNPTQLCTFIHDITERRQAEKMAIEAKEEWEKTFDAIDDIVTIHDQDMRIVRANRAAGELFHVAPETLTGRYCHSVFCDQDEPCEECPEVRARQDLKNHRAIIRHASLDRTFDICSFPVVEGGQLSGFVHTAKDITQRIKLEEQLKQSQKLEAIGTLAGGIAHDFNNILSPILGYSDMALLRNTTDATLTRHLKEINSAALRAKALVQQILSFSRQGVYEKKPFDPYQVVNEAINLLRSSLPTTIEFKTDIDKNCGEILADPTQYHQIIMNLCTNAYHAMGPQGGTLGVGLYQASIDESDSKVASSDLIPGDYVLLTISDTGCGMEQRVLERIFEPYFTTKASGKGTGLGLSIVHGIIKSYHGHISVYSEPGEGTTFRVYLPRLLSRTVAEVENEPTPLPKGSGRILVVDDEQIVTSMLEELLTGLGYQPDVLNSSREALALLQDKPTEYDLLITDMTMPHMTGLELAQEVMATNAKLPVILCTGFSELINKEQARAIGIRAYLTKPVSVRELALGVERILSEEL